jgi:hypothetical protein
LTKRQLLPFNVLAWAYPYSKSSPKSDCCQASQIGKGKYVEKSSNFFLKFSSTASVFAVIKGMKKRKTLPSIEGRTLHTNEIILYQQDRTVTLKVRLENETVWLTQAQIADLFGTQRPGITKHLRNIFSTRELDENSVCSILEHTAADGKKYQTKFFNLDAILSVGYRVNSINDMKCPP